MKVFKIFLLLFIGMFYFPIITASEKVGRPDPTKIPVTTRQPEERKVYPIAIIGAGAAGSMAVKRAVLNNNKVLLFTGAKQEQKRSRGYWVRKIDNIPGFGKYERAVLELRNESLKELVDSPLSRNLYIIEDSVVILEKKAEYFKLVDGSGRTFYAKYVVMATGIMDEQPHIEGSIRPVLKYANGQTVAYCALCDGHHSFGKKMVVIGHTEAAAKGALLLAEKYQLAGTTILTNGRSPQFTPELLQRMQEKNITILLDPIQEVLGNKEKRQLTGFKLKTEEVIEAQIAFVALGIRPNNQLALQLGAKVDATGLVVTNANGESSVANLFVVGDLRANSMKQVYTAWQHAVESLQLINQRIRQKAK